MYLYLYIIFFTLCLYGILYYITIKHDNFKKRNLNNEYYIQSFGNLIIACCIILIVCSNKDTLFSTTNTISFKNMIFYIIVADMFYYWFHRITHRIPGLKTLIHLTHHNSFNLLPLDVLYVNVIEFFLYTTITNFWPILISDISLIEYLIVSFILFVHTIYLHSESTHTFLIPLFTDSKCHKNHHQIGGGNYSFLSIWDDYMRTNIKTNKIKNNKIKNNKIKK